MHARRPVGGEPVRDVAELRADARANQQRVLEAAAAAVRRDGPRVPMATIATEAGVGVGTLYRRFPTREALLDALTRRSFLLVHDNVRAAEAGPGRAIDAIDRFLDRTIARREELVLPLHGGPPVSTAATRSAQADVHAAVQRLVTRGHDDGSLRRDVTTRDVIVFGAMLAQPLPTSTDWDATAHRVKAIYLAGLAPSPAEPARHRSR